MSKIILASHGGLAKGMLHSVNMIIGDLTKDVEVFCLYPGMTPDDFANDIKKRIEATDEKFIFIADIFKGSVHTALSQLTCYDNVSIFSGMNMNLVLSVLLGDQSDMSESIAEVIMNEAKAGITYRTNIETGEEEDF